jgi:antitoxin component YwqK of YwqJK toxin-antitoxin module
MEAILQVAEIKYDTGEVQYRYMRYLSEDKTQWIRHGLFCRYHKNGNLASEGNYEHGAEEGLWIDYHENGAKAAEGHYRSGVEVGIWNYWTSDGTQEDAEIFD